VAWTFVCPDQGQLLSNIEELANVEIPRKEYPDFTPGPIPREVLQRREADAKKRDELAVQRNRFTPAPVEESVRKIDVSAFPDGIVPSILPAKRMGGRIRTSRSR
jgi:hypothetical protein